jgi:hypothetical protein
VLGGALGLGPVADELVGGRQVVDGLHAPWTLTGR